MLLRNVLFCVALTTGLSLTTSHPAAAEPPLQLECRQTADFYECTTPDGNVLQLHQETPAPLAVAKEEAKDEHYLGLAYQSGGHAKYGFISRLKLVSLGSGFSFSARPSVFGGYDEDKVDQVQSVFDDIKPTEEEAAPVLERTFEVPEGLELPPGIDLDNLPSEYQHLVQVTEVPAGGLDPENTSDATLKRLEENFKNGKYSQLSEDDDDVEDYVFLQVGLPLTLDYRVSKDIVLYAGGGYAHGFFQQESAGILTTGVDFYLGKNFVLNSGLNTYFYEDTTDVAAQVGLGLTF